MLTPTLFFFFCLEAVKTGSDVLFILLGGIMVLAMHSGFAFLELGTVRKKNQVNALVKILVDFSVSTIAYFFVGFSVAYGVNFFSGADVLMQQNGFELTRFFFLLTFAAAIPAIISGGVAERAQFNPQLLATFAIVGFIYPFFEGIAWNQAFGIQTWLKGAFGEEFHDFAGSVVVHAMGGWLALPAVILLGARAGRYAKNGAIAAHPPSSIPFLALGAWILTAGSVVVHAMGGWIALPAVLLLGARYGRYTKEGRISAHPPSSIPFLALGAWILTVGWFGFNVMSAQTLDKISGLVALNSLMAMVGGTLMALLLGKNDPGFVHNGPLAGLVAVCAGSDVMHPIGALAVGGVAGALFLVMFTLTENRWRIDDVLGVWPLHGLCGAWGGIAAGIFGQKALGGAGGVAFMPQLLMTGLAIGIALVGSFIVYGLLKAAMGLRLDREEEFNGADLSIHRITATPEREPNW